MISRNRFWSSSLIAILSAAGFVESAYAASMVTYQGLLRDGGAAANGTFDFTFRVFASEDALFPVGDVVALNDVVVVDGVFTVELDIADDMDGSDRWLGVWVRPGANTGSYTSLLPRQKLTAAPHAIIADRFTVPMYVGGLTDPDIFGPNALMTITQNGSSPSIRGVTGGSGPAVLGSATNGGVGVQGESGGVGDAVRGLHGALSGYYNGVYGESASSNGRGVFGHAIAPTGSTAFGVQGFSESTTAGTSGVRGVANGGGTALNYGVRGETTSSGGAGVYGYGGKYGVYGLSTRGGIDSVGVLAISNQTDGVGAVGRCTGGGGAATGVLGQAPNGGWAGFFEGDVRVAGLLWANEKDFLIDNPADPENEYLFHASVESDERRNLYDGVVTLGEDGRAVVPLPDWFEKLNGNFRYQLTCIGGQAAVYVAREIEHGQFEIAGGAPGLRVSWQVTGIRIDADAASRPFSAVRPKGDAERGKFMNAAAHGKSDAEQIKRVPNVWRTPRPRSAEDQIDRDVQTAARHVQSGD